MRDDTKRTPQHNSAEALAALADMPFDPGDTPGTTALGETEPPISPEPASHSGSRRDDWRRGPFDHERLDAYSVSRNALVLGEAVARLLPADHTVLANEIRRTLLGGQLAVAHAASRGGRDRAERYHGARAEVARAAAALDAARSLGLVQSSDIEPVLNLLSRLSAMLVSLAAKVDGAR